MSVTLKIGTQTLNSHPDLKEKDDSEQFQIEETDKTRQITEMTSAHWSLHPGKISVIVKVNVDYIPVHVVISCDHYIFPNFGNC